MREDLLTLKDVMSRLKLSRATIYRLIEQGELKPFKIGQSLRFEEQDLAAFIARKKEPPEPKSPD
ncbi:Helix-turn-helix domain protein [compost metagenome]